jgi:hypothetical protein
MRKSNLFLLYIAVNLLLLLLIFFHASSKIKSDQRFLMEKREMVEKLKLTDLCLFTEASYTRHLSQADLYTPFQDHPVSLEHFPSGSILTPPPAVKGMNEKLD